MKPAWIAPLALVLLASLDGHGQTARSGPEQGSQPIPIYQSRGAPPPGDRLASGRDGHQLFRNRCGYCHLRGGMGTNVLAARVREGQMAGPALLEERTDLTADYIRTVVRNGKVAMPRLSRVEVTDPELDAIAAYLAGPRPK
ncbi:MAG TPA: cytochrome c [Stellaceae bacterium]|nr:cytochrome c [Stellaceae bacterium]